MAIIDGCHSYLSAFLFLETSFPLFIAELESQSQQLSLWINDFLFTNGDVGPGVVGDDGDDDDDVVGNDDDDGGDNSCTSLKDHS